MEVDPHPSSSSPIPSGSGTLKRSNSAPMINSLVTSQPDISPPTTFKPATAVAARRMSSSIMSLNTSPAPASPPIRGTDRVARIKQEEIHIADRERQHEREIQSSLWISNNWDHLSLDPMEPMDSQHRRPRSFSESLHIMTQSNILCGSPSPTRGPVKQCFSPKMQIPVKNNTFTPSPSPSPTRKNFMRSLSPIAVRTGPLKRKFEGDGAGDRYDYISPPKKFNTGPATPDRIMTCLHPLANSPDHLGSPSHPSRIGRQHHSSAPGIVQHFYHHQPYHSGARSPHSTLSSSSSSGGGGVAGISHPSGHSPLSSGSPHSASGGGGHSPHTPVLTSVSSNSSGTLAPVMLSAKQAFLFQPVSEALSSPSSTSSSSSLSSSSTPMSLLQQQQQHQQHAFQQQQQGEEEQHLHHHHHHHHPSQSDKVQISVTEMGCDDAASHGSNNDVYMADSDMGDAQCLDKAPASRGFNFKPISPDHT